MNVTINGNAQQLNSVKNLSEVVCSFCKAPKHVITELNGAIIPAEQWSVTNLSDGDTLELVTFVGGG